MITMETEQISHDNQAVREDEGFRHVRSSIQISLTCKNNSSPQKTTTCCAIGCVLRKLVSICVLAGRHVLLPLWQWDTGNVYLLAGQH